MKRTVIWSLLLFLPVAMYPGISASGGEVPGTTEVMILTLDEAVEITRRNNLSLANASIEVRKAEKNKEIADRAGYPEVSIEAGWVRLDEGEGEPVTIPGLGEIGFDTPDSDADIALSARMPLYTGGRISAGKDRASIARDLAGQGRRVTYGDIILEVIITFHELLSAQDEVKITEEALDVSKRHLADVNSLLKQGMVARLDLIRTELDLAERERDLAASRTRLVLSAERLSAILFPDRPVPIRVKGAFDEPVPPVQVEEWLAKAAAGSPELTSARLNVDLARASIKARKAEGKANLALFGNYGSSGEDPTLDDEDRYWNAGVSLSVPLYQGGRTTAAVEREIEAKIQAENSLAIARRETRRAIVEGAELMKLAASEYSTAQKAIEAGEENLRVTTLKYQQGLVINTDVIDAQLSLTRLRLLRVTALKAYHNNRARLLRIVGSIEEIP